MRIPRIYQSTRLTVGETLSLTADAANHLVRVLRLLAGAEIRVFNGEGGEFSAQIIAIDKKQVLVEIGKYSVVNTESAFRVHLGQAIARGEKMDYILQKTVELGVSKITPLLTTRCGVQLSKERWDKRLRHWQAIIINACEQCGRDKIPMITLPILLQDWLVNSFDKNFSGCRKFVLDPAAPQKLSAFSSVFQSLPAVKLLVGAEGGLTESEINLAVQNDFAAVCLGPRILRTETAAVVALAALQSYGGDF